MVEHSSANPKVTSLIQGPVFIQGLVKYTRSCINPISHPTNIIVGLVNIQNTYKLFLPSLF